VVNCAAYTQVDKAESEPERAFAINRDAARAIAQGVNNYGGCLLQVSTDFIFAGDRSVPYREDVWFMGVHNCCDISGNQHWAKGSGKPRIFGPLIVLVISAQFQDDWIEIFLSAIEPKLAFF